MDYLVPLWVRQYLTQRQRRGMSGKGPSKIAHDKNKNRKTAIMSDHEFTSPQNRTTFLFLTMFGQLLCSLLLEHKQKYRKMLRIISLPSAQKPFKIEAS